MALMCSMPVKFAEFNQRYGIDFQSYFADEVAALAPYQEAELIQVDDHTIQVLDAGRLFVRAFSMVFDKYLQQRTTASYSRLI